MNTISPQGVFVVDKLMYIACVQYYRSLRLGSTDGCGQLPFGKTTLQSYNVRTKPRQNREEKTLISSCGT